MKKEPAKSKFIVSLLTVILPICSLCVAVIALGPGLLTTVDWIKGKALEINNFNVSIYKDFATYSNNYIISDLPKEMSSLSPDLQKTQNAIGNTLVLMASNSKISDEIILSKQIPVRLLSYLPDDNQTPDVFKYLGGGGPAFYWNFKVEIPPTSGKTVYAEYDSSGQDYIDQMWKGNNNSTLPNGNKPDYFVLEPGDKELFAIDFRFNHAGKYTFQVGIEFNDGDKTSIKWINKEYTAYIPANINLYTGNGTITTGDLEYVGECKFSGIPKEGLQDYDCK